MLGLLAFDPVGAAAADPLPPRIEVPVYQTITHSHTRRYWVPLSIGNGPMVPAFLDTGSVGLMLLDNGGTLAKPLPLGPVLVYTYGSNKSAIELFARRSLMNITLGNSASLHTTPLGIVKSVKCLSETPHCEAETLKFEDYQIAGEGEKGQGFRAILGVGLGPSVLANPLLAFGDRWIIVSPVAGSDSPGKLIINPTDAETEGFIRFHVTKSALRGRGAFRSGIPGCLVARPAADRFCGDVLLDTGSPGMIVMTDNEKLFDRMSTALKYTLEVGEANDKLAWDFVIKPEQFARPPKQFARYYTAAGIVFGEPAFAQYSVLYDFHGDTIGLKPR